MSCDTCNWNYDNQCVSESEETYGHPTQYSNECIGYLDKEFEHELWKTYEECIELLGKRKLAELLEIKSFILNQRS